MRRIHPGEILRDFFLHQGEIPSVEILMRAARKTNSAVFRKDWIDLNQIIDGKKPISKEMIEIIAAGTDTTPQLWNNLQIMYYANVHPIT